MVSGACKKIAQKAPADVPFGQYQLGQAEQDAKCVRSTHRFGIHASPPETDADVEHVLAPYRSCRTLKRHQRIQTDRGHGLRKMQQLECQDPFALSLF